MKLASVLVIGTATAVNVRGGNLRFDAADSCSDFNGHFSKFPGMKAVCKTNNGPIKKKWFCNLKCNNNYPNVWSTRPIKCKVRNMGKPDESYTWKPNTIKGADTLCDEKDDCGSLKSQYNVSNKLLEWSKSQPTVRTTMFNFTCKPYTHTNGKVFDMVPFPKDFATCTCNYNKPSNIRCKWSKIKNSIVRCVRSDYNKLNDGAFADEYFDEMYQYDE